MIAKNEKQNSVEVKNGRRIKKETEEERSDILHLLSFTPCINAAFHWDRELVITWSRDRFCPKYAVNLWTQVVNLWFWRLPSCSCMTNEKKLGENDGNEGNKVLTLLIFCSIINHQCPRALLPVSYMYLQFYGITYRLVFVLFVSLHRKFGTP